MRTLGFAATAAFTMGLLVSCGQTHTKCTSANCAGCCDVSGSCQTGNTLQACGTGGAVCATCIGSQQCSSGLCLSGSTGGGSAGGGSAGGGSAGGGSAGGGSAGGGSAGGGSAGGGSAGGGSAGGGSAGGGAAGGGSGGGSAGPRDVTISQARALSGCAEFVRVRGVVVTAVDDYVSGTGVLSRFWVSDPAIPGDTLYVEKFYSDVPTTYAATVGDLLDIEGYMAQMNAHQDRIAYRPVFKNHVGCPGGGTGSPFTLTVVGTTSPPADFTVSAGFGNAQSGTVKPNAAQAGRRVFIPGSLQVTQGNPPPFKRISNSTTDAVYFGFEVTGGVLVNNGKTFRSDGGCPWRDVVNDGGSVTFPNGIHGVWDTYSHSPCYDGTTGCSLSTSQRDAGLVPTTNNDYTYVLYPQGCADIAGQ